MILAQISRKHAGQRPRSIIAHILHHNQSGLHCFIPRAQVHEWGHTSDEECPGHDYDYGTKGSEPYRRNKWEAAVANR